MKTEPSFSPLAATGFIPRNASTVAEVPDTFELVQSDVDILATLDHIGQPEENSDTGCLFIRVEDGDIAEVYQCSYSVPYLSARVYKLL